MHAETLICRYLKADELQARTSAGLSVDALTTDTLTADTVAADTLTLDTPLGVASGGSGLASGTSGGVLAFTGSTTLASSAALTAGGIVLGGGAGAVPVTDAALSFDTSDDTLTPGKIIAFTDNAAAVTAAREVAFNGTLPGYGDGTITHYLPGGMSIANLSASTAIANTTSETAFSKSKTFAANTLNIAGTIIRIHASGVYSNTGTPSLALRIRLGGSGKNVAAYTFTTPSGASGYGWQAIGELIVRTTGSSGTYQPSYGAFMLGGLTVDMVGGIVSNEVTSINYTGTLTCDVSAQWGAMSASNTITLRTLTITVGYPSETIA